jgi:hypothetical protein
MTWAQIKKAAEEAGISDDEEISLIQCEYREGEGDRSFHKVKLGKTVKLAENMSANKARAAANGCAC